MELKNSNEQELNQALTEVNKRFAGNIRLNDVRSKGRKLIFTLRTNSSKNPGGARSASGRRTGSACWHAHGYFFEELLEINPEAVIKSVIGTIDNNGGNWEDQNCGSMMYPAMMSDCCDCE